MSDTDDDELDENERAAAELRAKETAREKEIYEEREQKKKELLEKQKEAEFTKIREEAKIRDQKETEKQKKVEDLQNQQKNAKDEKKARLRAKQQMQEEIQLKIKEKEKADKEATKLKLKEEARIRQEEEKKSEEEEELRLKEIARKKQEEEDNKAQENMRQRMEDARLKLIDQEKKMAMAEKVKQKRAESDKKLEKLVAQKEEDMLRNLGLADDQEEVIETIKAHTPTIAVIKSKGMVDQHDEEDSFVDFGMRDKMEVSRIREPKIDNSIHNCSFCIKIKDMKDISTVYQDEHYTVFVSHVPINPGHLIIASNTHYSSFAQYGEDFIGGLYKLAHKIINILLQSDTKWDGVSLYMGDNIETDQEHLQHTHLNIIPRLKDDAFEMKLAGKERSEKYIDKSVDYIKEAIYKASLLPK